MPEKPEDILSAEPKYGGFWETPGCRCWPNGLAATLCMEGHMTECHVGKTCDVARCSHWARAVLAERDGD